MKRDQTRDDMVEHLREQVGFLSMSCQLFDEGREAEAKRIAVVVRTLVHDTAISHSLLNQLGYKHKMHFVAQNYVYKPWSMLMFHGLVGLLVPAEGPRFLPHLDALTPRLLSFDDWWSEPVLSNRARQHLHSRKDLVLALANKEGGAHVAPELDETYARLARDFDFGMKVVIGGQEFDWKQNPYLPSVRQIGHELLRTVSGMEILRTPQPETTEEPPEGEAS